METEELIYTPKEVECGFIYKVGTLQVIDIYQPNKKMIRLMFGIN